MDKMYEMIGESIWDTYRNMASILSETEFGETTRAQLKKSDERKAKAREAALASKAPLHGTRVPESERVRISRVVSAAGEKSRISPPGRVSRIQYEG